jgi:putative Mg2+ transporter-C (MgtC) family protein
MFDLPSIDPMYLTSAKQLIIASFLGGLVGLERDIHGRNAGVRTYLLVTLGSTLFMILSRTIGTAGGVGIISDPARIGAQIVAGVGFLGAGAIMKEGFSVKGLTTASCFWVVAAIGMAIGNDQIFLGVTTTALTLFALMGLNNLDAVFKRDSYRILNIKAEIDISEKEVVDAIQVKDVKVLSMDISKDYKKGEKQFKVAIRIRHKERTDLYCNSVFSALEKFEQQIQKVSWTYGKMN